VVKRLGCCGLVVTKGLTPQSSAEEVGDEVRDDEVEGGAVVHEADDGG